MLARHRDLCQFLIENQPSTFEDCCLYLGISKPTLRSDVEIINEDLSSYNLAILFKDNYLIFSDINQATKLTKIMDSLVELDPESQMLLLLLLSKDALPLQRIADILYVSKGKIVQVANMITHKYPKEIKAGHHGYQFVGEEQVRRELFVNCLFPYFKRNTFLEEIRTFSETSFNLLFYLSESQIIEIVVLLNDLFVHGVETNDSEKIQAFLSAIFYKIRNTEISMKDLIKRLVETFPWFTFVSRETEMLKKEKIIEQMVNSIDEVLSTHFQEDEELKVGLVNHLSFHSRRYEQLSLKLPELFDIKNRFPLSYEAAVLSSQYLGKVNGIFLQEDELIYLAIHFQNSIEKRKKEISKIKTLILTPYGTTSGKLIENQLSQKFDELIITNIMSYSELLTKKELLPDIDLVLSLSYVELESTPTIFLPLVLSDDYVKEIEKFIYFNKNKHHLTTLIEDAQLHNLTTFENMEETFNWLKKVLQDSGCVTHAYFDSLVSREEMSSTSIKGIAVPHGKAMHVLHDRLFIIHLDRPVSWGNHDVNWIFLLVLTEKTMKKQPQMFNHFYRTIAKKKFYIDIQKCYLGKTNFREELIELFQIQ